MKQRLTKDMIPQDFTMKLVIVDAIPVLFYGINTILIGTLFHNWLFILGAVLCLLAGAGKVLWKFLVVKIKKNIWPLFIQMRIFMPLGFLLIILSLVFLRGDLTFQQVWAAIIQLPQLIFFALGLLGMLLMMIFAIALSNSDLKSNWIEQITNGIAQICIFIGLLCILI